MGRMDVLGTRSSDGSYPLCGIQLYNGVWNSHTGDVDRKSRRLDGNSLPQGSGPNWPTRVNVDLFAYIWLYQCIYIAYFHIAYFQTPQALCAAQ